MNQQKRVRLTVTYQKVLFNHFLSGAGVVAAVGFVPAVAVSVAGVVVNELDHVHPSLIAKKLGVLMKPGLIINVTGGPPKTQVDVRNETQTIYMNPEFEPLRIEIP